MSSKARSSAATHGEKPPRKRNKKKPSPATEPTSISSLPYDLLLNCIARVSRLYYPILSLVSKHFRSIVTSPELYELRSLINRTESCLYLCLRYPRPHDPNTYWFTLCRKPNRTIIKDKSSSGNLFIQIPSPHLSPVQSTSIVSVGSNIYKIGGYPYSSRVSVLDARFNTWHKAPRMQVKRSSPSSSLLDGKIYVAGGCRDVNSSNWVEVFDPKTQTWGNLTNPSKERRESEVKSVGIGGKLYLFGDECVVVYDPKECKWKPVGVDLGMVCGVDYSYGVVNDVLFFWYDGVFNWYDCMVSSWKTLNGCEGLPDFRRRDYCKMVDHGGKLAVLWDDYVYSKGYAVKKVVWCAEIALERRDGDEMWGKVEWFDIVLTINGSCRLLDGDVLSTTV